MESSSVRARWLPDGWTNLNYTIEDDDDGVYKNVYLEYIDYQGDYHKTFEEGYFKDPKVLLYVSYTGVKTLEFGERAAVERLEKVRETLRERVAEAKLRARRVANDILLVRTMERAGEFTHLYGEDATLLDDISDPLRLINVQLAEGFLNEFLGQVLELINPSSVLSRFETIENILRDHQVYESQEMLDEFDYVSKLRGISQRGDAKIAQALIKANGDPVKAAGLVMASEKIRIGDVLDRMSWKSVQKYLSDGKGGIVDTTVDVPIKGTYVAIKYAKREGEDWVDVWTWDHGFTKLIGIPWHIQYDLNGNEIKREYDNMPY